jgi:leader peptidase (prepilin peptidase) / N-methyltransferase
MLAWIIPPLCAAPVGWLIRRLGRALTGTEPNLVVCMAGAALAAIAAMLTPDAPLGESLLLAWTLLALAIIDVVSLRLPDLLTGPLLLAGLIFALPEADAVPDRLIGAIVGFGVLAALAATYLRLRGRHGLGLGDAKLLGAAGAWLGWRPLPAVVLLASAAGLVWVAMRVLRTGRVALLSPLPFGAPLCLTVWVTWMTHLGASG